MCHLLLRILDGMVCRFYTDEFHSSRKLQMHELLMLSQYAQTVNQYNMIADIIKILPREPLVMIALSFLKGVKQYKL